MEQAQQEVRRAYVGGGVGALVSGLLWAGAAMVLRWRGVSPAYTFLFFGGFLIFPLSLLIVRTVFGRAEVSKSNPMPRVALESTLIMFPGLLAAWLLLPVRPALVFPLAAMSVGAHYAGFRTAYGDVLFWVLGGLMTLAGMVSLYWFPWVGDCPWWKERSSLALQGC